MRKNLLIATLLSLCVFGLTACSKGEENKPADEASQTTALNAPATEQPAAETVQPTQTADAQAAAPAAEAAPAAPAPAAEAAPAPAAEAAPAPAAEAPAAAPVEEKKEDTSAAPAAPAAEQK